MKARLLLLLFTLLLLPAAPVRAAEDIPENAEWWQANFKSGDGTTLHADILRPKGLPKDAKTPVLLSVGPYFNHSGQVGALGPVQDTDYDPTGEAKPSPRFYDFVKGAKILERGYTWVMVDLRGFGGSGGCLDWSGPGEQMDVKAAVEWSASQPWSTGAVGLYGKSYDGVTGLIGGLQNAKGLKAVVSMEPVYDMYRYLYSNGVRYLNSAATPALYDGIAATPGPLADDPMYNINGATDPACLATNYGSQQDANPDSEYWKARNFIPRAPEGTVPLFLMQGFLENNTKPDGAFDFFNSYAGPKRAWFGMWDHVRGNDKTSDDRYVVGRATFFDEVMRFFDHYVRGVPLADAPTHKDPPVAVQTSDGSWRSEAKWPPADSKHVTVELKPGSYQGDGQNEGTGRSASGNGLWTISPPLQHDAWYAGVPKATLDLSGSTGAPAQVVVDTYDIYPESTDDGAPMLAILLSRNASLIPADGKVQLDLYGNDWKLAEGHRLGILVTDTNAEWWLPSGGSNIELKSGSVTLPFLQHKRPKTIAGESSVRLEQWMGQAPFPVTPELLEANTVANFPLPGALKAAPVVKPKPKPSTGKRLRVRIARKGKRRVVVYGDAPQGVRVKVRLQRGARVIKTRRVKTKVNAFRITFRVKKAGRYRAVVNAKAGGKRLKARSKRVRVK